MYIYGRGRDAACHAPWLGGMCIRLCVYANLLAERSCVYTFAYMYKYMYIYTNVYIHICIYIYIYIY